MHKVVGLLLDVGIDNGHHLCVCGGGGGVGCQELGSNQRYAGTEYEITVTASGRMRGKCWEHMVMCIGGGKGALKYRTHLIHYTAPSSPPVPLSLPFTPSLLPSPSSHLPPK